MNPEVNNIVPETIERIESAVSHLPEVNREILENAEALISGGEKIEVISEKKQISGSNDNSVIDKKSLNNIVDKNTTLTDSNYANDIPNTAADLDKIESVWIDSAKKIIQSTIDNPKERENRINNLKYEYLKKRYNHDLEK